MGAHMRDKGHCKLQLEYGPNLTYNEQNEAILNEEDESPFAKFFDFDKNLRDVDEVGGRELMLMKDRRFVPDINENSELILNDGTLIGHRSHLVTYKQRHAQLSK